MLHPALPTLGFLAAVLALIPLPRQIQARYIPTIATSLWLFGSCVIQSVNVIVWAGNTNNPIPVWCDITSRFWIAAELGLPAASLCICKHLEHVSSGRPITDRFRQIFEVIMCFIIPCLWIFVVYCFQPSRFIILENIGCTIQPYNSYVAMAIWQLPPLLFSVGTLMFGSVAFYRLIRNFRMNTSVLDSHLQSHDSSLSSVRYYRLMAVSIAFGIWDIGWISTGFDLAILGSGSLPSWKTVHSGDSKVATPDLKPDLMAINLALWWAVPGAAYLYFLLFGASREVLSDYRKFWVWFRIRVLRQTVPVESVSTTKFTGHSVSTYLTTVTIDELKLPKPVLSSEALRSP